MNILPEAVAAAVEIHQRDWDLLRHHLMSQGADDHSSCEEIRETIAAIISSAFAALVEERDDWRQRSMNHALERDQLQSRLDKVLKAGEKFVGYYEMCTSSWNTALAKRAFREAMEEAKKP